MSAPAARPIRRRSRLRLAVAALMCVVVVIAVDADRRRRRVQWLVAEVNGAGGGATLPPPLIRWGELRRVGAWNVRHLRSELDDEVSVRFAATMDEDWLRDHDDLAGLEISYLGLANWSGPAAHLTTFMRVHPIESVYAEGAQGADDIALALLDSATLRIARFSYSSLTDAGFHSLPLEQLERIEISGTHVSPQGVSELRRCRELTHLRVSGRHAEFAISALVECGRAMDTLEIEDDVEVRQLARLSELKLDTLWLLATSVSMDDFNELQRQLPDCSLRR